VLRIHTDRCLETRVHNLQRGTIRWRQSQSRSTHDNIGEMVKATVRIGEYGQTMCRPAAHADCSEESAIAIAIWLKPFGGAVVAVGQIVRWVHRQGETREC
jgi:hypothetical protein